MYTIGEMFLSAKFDATPYNGEVKLTLLMIPGPVGVHPRIMKAMSVPMIGHRTSEFSNILGNCLDRIGDVMGSTGRTAILSATGTAAMEAAIANLVRGDTVLTLDNGKFGERFTIISNRYGKAIPLEFNWGGSIDLSVVEDAMKKHQPKVVTMVHNETSTGILNPVDEVAELAREYGVMLVVDCITTCGGDEVKTDEWGAAITVAGSQKCLGIPPGLSIVAVSEGTEKNFVENPPFYLDLKSYLDNAGKDEPSTPFTPAVSLILGLDEALTMIEDEGMKTRIEHHRTASETMRSAITALGCELFPSLNDASRYSNTVTAAHLPAKISPSELSGGMLKQGVQISGGQNRIKGKIFRIATMGNFTNNDIIKCVTALDTVLSDAGVGSSGAGIAVANRILG